MDCMRIRGRAGHTRRERALYVEELLEPAGWSARRTCLAYTPCPPILDHLLERSDASVEHSAHVLPALVPPGDGVRRAR